VWAEGGEGGGSYSDLLQASYNEMACQITSRGQIPIRMRVIASWSNPNWNSGSVARPEYSCSIHHSETRAVAGVCVWGYAPHTDVTHTAPRCLSTGKCEVETSRAVYFDTRAIIIDILIYCVKP
jgi:hypothetical protein